eukprot:Platyproteum_vivax@DN4804_c0_g1_i1.p1
MSTAPTIPSRDRKLPLTDDMETPTDKPAVEHSFKQNHEAELAMKLSNTRFQIKHKSKPNSECRPSENSASAGGVPVKKEKLSSIEKPATKNRLVPLQNANKAVNEVILDRPADKLEEASDEANLVEAKEKRGIETIHDQFFSRLSKTKSTYETSASASFTRPRKVKSVLEAAADSKTRKSPLLAASIGSVEVGATKVGSVDFSKGLSTNNTASKPTDLKSKIGLEADQKPRPTDPTPFLKYTESGIGSPRKPDVKRGPTAHSETSANQSSDRRMDSPHGLFSSPKPYSKTPTQSSNSYVNLINGEAQRSLMPSSKLSNKAPVKSAVAASHQTPTKIAGAAHDVLSPPKPAVKRTPENLPEQENRLQANVENHVNVTIKSSKLRIENKLNDTTQVTNINPAITPTVGVQNLTKLPNSINAVSHHDTSSSNASEQHRGLSSNITISTSVRSKTGNVRASQQNAPTLSAKLPHSTTPSGYKQRSSHVTQHHTINICVDAKAHFQTNTIPHIRPQNPNTDVLHVRSIDPSTSSVVLPGSITHNKSEAFLLAQLPTISCSDRFSHRTSRSGSYLDMMNTLPTLQRRSSVGAIFHQPVTRVYSSSYDGTPTMRPAHHPANRIVNEHFAHDAALQENSRIASFNRNLSASHRNTKTVGGSFGRKFRAKIARQ